MLKALRKSYALYYVGTFGVMGLRFAQNVLVARSVGPVDMGLFLGIMVITLLLGRLFDLSLSHAFVYGIRHDRQNFTSAMATLILHTLVVGPPALAAIFILRYVPFENEATGLLVATQLPELSLIAISTMFSGTLTAMFVADRNFLASTIIGSAPPAIFVCLLLVAYITPDSHLDAGELIWDMALSEAVGGLLALMVGVLRAWQCGFDHFLFKADYYKYGGRVHIGVLFKLAITRLDRVIVAIFVSPAGFALYTVGASFRELTQIPANMYITIYQNDIISLKKQGKHYGSLLRLASAVWAIVLLVSSGVLYLVAEPVVVLIYGPAFQAAAPLMVIMCLANIGTVLASLCWATALALGRPGVTSVMTIGGGIPGLAVLTALTWLYGTEGAAWATVVNSLLILVVGWLGLYWLKTHPLPPSKN